MESIRPEFDRPAPFLLDTREWIVCDEEDMEGFAILVRTSISNAEQRDLLARHAVIVRDADAWEEEPPEQRKTRGEDAEPRAREWTLMAPYVLDWNAAEVVNGEPVPIPSPAVDGAAAFSRVTAQCSTWILRVLLIGYLSTGKARKLRSRSGSPGDMSGPAVDPASADPDPNPPPN